VFEVFTFVFYRHERWGFLPAIVIRGNADTGVHEVTVFAGIQGVFGAQAKVGAEVGEISPLFLVPPGDDEPEPEPKAPPKRKRPAKKG
jgi:hypothetical protein